MPVVAAPSRRPVAIAGALALVLVLVAATLEFWPRGRAASTCSAEPSVAGAQVPPVFDTGAALRKEQDPRLRRLIAAVNRMPFGKVVGAVGYDYGQYVSVSGLPGALGVTTKQNPALGIFDPDLRPAWGIRQSDVQHAYDVGAGRYFALTLAKDKPLQISAYSLAKGQLRWCASVGAVPTRYGDPLGTDVLPNGDVLVLADGRGPAATLSRLDGGYGKARWTRTLSAADHGDSLTSLGDVVVLGGRPAYQLARNGDHPKGGLVAVDPGTGRTAWSYAPDRPVHLLGATGGRPVLEQGDLAQGVRLVGLDAEGRPAWRVRPATGFYDAALFGDTVVVKTGHALMGYDAATGRRRWRSAYPVRPQLFPYGFELASTPFLDSGHILLGTTAALRSLDLRTGRMTSYPLPTDGINTTFWPYQVVVTPTNVAVVTNTGTVVTRR